MTPSSVPDTTIAARFDETYLAGVLANIFNAPVSGVAYSPLPGDASDRKYFRAFYNQPASGSDGRSLIIMQLQEPVSGTEPDFNRMLGFLRSLDTPAPELFYYDQARGLLFIEDCGPDTLEDYLRRHPGETRACYLEAVRLLVDLQQKATQNIGPDCPAYHLRFDVEKLMWEMDFMLTHYVEGLSQRPLNPGERESVRKQLLSLCQTLAAERLCFTHRDFHSRNIMIAKGKLTLLDFQDARMGPCQYDLVSLLKDSYIVLDDRLRDELTETFIRLKEAAEGRPIDRDSFLRIFDLMSIQRNLKAVGTFAFQSVEKKRDRYLQYIAPTLDYVRKTLNQRSEFRPLRDTLFESIPGLKPGGGENLI